MSHESLLQNEAVGGEVFIRTVTSTLRDYYPDFEKWLDEYLLPRYLKVTLMGLLESYLAQLCADDPRFVASQRKEKSRTKAKLTLSQMQTQMHGAVQGAVGGLTGVAQGVAQGVQAAGGGLGMSTHGSVHGSVHSDTRAEAREGEEVQSEAPVAALLSHRPFRNVDLVAKRLESDAAELLAEYEKVADELAMVGISSVEAVLEPIALLGAIVAARVSCSRPRAGNADAWLLSRDFCGYLLRRHRPMPRRPQERWSRHCRLR